MAAEFFTVLIGSSIIKSLEDNIHLKKLKVIAAGGLTFESRIMNDIKREIKQECSGKKKINIVLHPPGNSLFPGTLRGTCYIKGSKPLSALDMAESTVKFLSEIQISLSTDSDVQFTVLPGLGRRRTKCNRLCSECIAYTNFAEKLVKYENHLIKIKPSNVEIVSITQFSKFLQETSCTSKIRNLLKQTDYRLRTEKISNFKHKMKTYSVISGLLLRCSRHSQQKLFQTDKIHVCCDITRNVLSQFISSILY